MTATATAVSFRNNDCDYDVGDCERICNGDDDCDVGDRDRDDCTCSGDRDCDADDSNRDECDDCRE